MSIKCLRRISAILKPIYNKNVVDIILDEYISFIESKNQTDDVFEMKV